MDLETRQFAAFVGKVTLNVKDVLARARVQRFSVHRGPPCLGTYPHWMALSEPLDRTSTALLEEELNRAFRFEPRHDHGYWVADPKPGPADQAVYLAWSGSEYPGLPRH